MSHVFLGSMRSDPLWKYFASQLGRRYNRAQPPTKRSRAHTRPTACRAYSLYTRHVQLAVSLRVGAHTGRTVYGCDGTRWRLGLCMARLLFVKRTPALERLLQKGICIRGGAVTRRDSIGRCATFLNPSTNFTLSLNVRGRSVGLHNRMRL